MPTRGTKSHVLPQDRGVGDGKKIQIFNLASPSSPVLELMVNPKTINYSYNKRITTYQTRGAWVEEHWAFDELTEIQGQVDSLSFSDWLPLTPTLDEASLYREAEQAGSETPFGWRLIAGPFQHNTPMGVNIHHTLQIFLNGGALYDERGIVQYHKGLMMVYDGNVYFGHIVNLSLSEDADRPYTNNWNFTFRVTFSINEISGVPPSDLLTVGRLST